MRVEATAKFQRWINALKDRPVRARILVRIDRLAHGHPGQYRRLAAGLWELKIDVGPGYRVYYTQRGADLIILLGGGDKSSQTRDIAAALALARSLKE
jgi:putative addiction module killer protein